MEENQYLSIEQVEEMLLEQFPPTPDLEPFAGDTDATWVYWTDMDTSERGVPEEWIWERLRLKRDALLSECDWRVVNDAPWDITPWQEYRNALRNLPQNTINPRLAEWPEKPE